MSSANYPGRAGHWWLYMFGRREERGERENNKNKKDTKKTNSFLGIVWANWKATASAADPLGEIFQGARRV